MLIFQENCASLQDEAEVWEELLKTLREIPLRDITAAQPL